MVFQGQDASSNREFLPFHQDTTDTTRHDTLLLRDVCFFSLISRSLGTWVPFTMASATKRDEMRCSYPRVAQQPPSCRSTMVHSPFGSWIECPFEPHHSWAGTSRLPGILGQTKACWLPDPFDRRPPPESRFLTAWAHNRLFEIRPAADRCYSSHSPPRLVWCFRGVLFFSFPRCLIPPAVGHTVASAKGKSGCSFLPCYTLLLQSHKYIHSPPAPFINILLGQAMLPGWSHGRFDNPT